MTNVVTRNGIICKNLMERFFYRSKCGWTAAQNQINCYPMESKGIFLIPESMLGPATVIARPMKALLDSRVHSCKAIV